MQYTLIEQSKICLTLNGSFSAINIKINVLCIENSVIYVQHETYLFQYKTIEMCISFDIPEDQIFKKVFMLNFSDMLNDSCLTSQLSNINKLYTETVMLFKNA